MSQVQKANVQSRLTEGTLDFEHEHLIAIDQTFCLQELNKSFLSRVTALDACCYIVPWSEELFRKEFEKTVSLICGVITGSELIAHCFSHVVCDELHVLNLAVVKEYRGFGFGNALLCHSFLRAIGRGAKLATLEVRRSNITAQRLYRKLGFRIVAVRKCYYHDTHEDAFVLSRTLSRKDQLLFERQITDCRNLTRGSI